MEAKTSEKEPKEGEKSKLTSSADHSEVEQLEVKWRTSLIMVKGRGSKLRSDREQPSLTQKPDWFDEKLFNQAKKVYARNFMAINFIHLSGLLLLVRVDSIFRTLSSTGKSDSVAKLFNRYYQTLCHVKTWYEGDIFDDDSDARNSILIVRGKHNNVSTSLNDAKTTTSSNEQKAQHEDQVGAGDQPTTIKDRNQTQVPNVHISQYDIMLTQFAFIGFLVIEPTKFGLLVDYDRQDAESILHFWRVIGYYLGAKDEFNLCAGNLEDVSAKCQVLKESEYKASIAKNPTKSAPGVMSINIVRSLKFIPMLTICGMMRYLYENLGLDTEEFRRRETTFSRLSYTFIRLVMTRLLGYRILRSFNNGLTRLSIYLVGKVENWFANRLESKYGPELKNY